MQKRDKCYKKMKKHPHNQRYENDFLKLQKETNRRIKQAKHTFLNSNIVKSGNDIKKIWTTINTALNVSSQKNDTLIKKFE